MNGKEIPSRRTAVLMGDSNSHAGTHPLTTICSISFHGDDTLRDVPRTMLHGLRCVREELRRLLPGAAAMALTISQLRALRGTAEAEMPGATLEAIWIEGIRRAVAAAGGAPDSAIARHSQRCCPSERCSRRWMAGQTRTGDDPPATGSLAATGDTTTLLSVAPRHRPVAWHSSSQQLQRTA